MALNIEERAEIRTEFAEFEKVDSERSAPLYVAIARHIAAHPGALDVFEAVPETKRKPVMLFAAVHLMVLRGEGEGLTRIYEAPEDRRSIEVAGSAFVTFVEDHSDELVEIMNERAVQTNEVNRCVALLPALMTIHREHRQPLALIEVGASAGLNLLFDRYRYDYAGGPVIGPPGATVRLGTHLRGRVPRMDAVAPPVEFRVGIDLEPIDVNDDDAVLWLRACIWAGDVARDQRLTAAAALARREWPEIQQGNAVSSLSSLIGPTSEDLQVVVFSSWTMSWMARHERESLVEVLAQIGNNRRVSLVTYESPGKVPGLDTPEGTDSTTSVLGLQTFGPDGHNSRPLALVHAHGAWLDWVDSGTAAW